MSRPRFKTRRTEHPGQDPHWQDVKSPTSWQHLRPVPYKRDSPRQVPASHEKSPPRTTSLRLARQVSASHDKSLPRTTSLLHELSPTPTGAWAMTRGTSLGREHHHRNMWGNDSPRHANTPAGSHASSWP
jgi:hypothetical protein